MIKFFNSRLTKVGATAIMAVMFSAAPLSLPTINAQSRSTTVYICTGTHAKSYHSRKDCSGMNNCKAEIKAVTKEKAVSMKRSPCGTCCR